MRQELTLEEALTMQPIPWRLLSRDDLVTACEMADRYGMVAHLKAARAALRRRDGCGR